MTSKVSANIGHLRGSDIGRVISPSLLTLMFSLFECMTEGCTGSLVRPLVAETGDRNIFFVYSIFVVISVFAVMNLFTAMFVENTMAAAKVNYDKIRREKDLHSKEMAKKLQQLASEIVKLESMHEQDEDRKRQIEQEAEQLRQASISRESFNKAIKLSKGRRILDELEIPEGDREELFDVLDADGNEVLDIEELFHGLIKVRGQARSLDAVAVRLKVEELQKEFKEDMQTHKEFLHRVMDKMDEMIEGGPARKQRGEAKPVPEQSPLPPSDHLLPLHPPSVPPPIFPLTERPGAGYLRKSEGSEAKPPQVHGPPNDRDAGDQRRCEDEGGHGAAPELEPPRGQYGIHVDHLVDIDATDILRYF